MARCRDLNSSSFWYARCLTRRSCFFLQYITFPLDFLFCEDLSLKFKRADEILIVWVTKFTAEPLLWTFIPCRCLCTSLRLCAAATCFSWCLQKFIRRKAQSARVSTDNHWEFLWTARLTWIQSLIDLVVFFDLIFRLPNNYRVFYTYTFCHCYLRKCGDSINLWLFEFRALFPGSEFCHVMNLIISLWFWF